MCPAHKVLASVCGISCVVRCLIRPHGHMLRVQQHHRHCDTFCSLKSGSDTGGSDTHFVGDAAPNKPFALVLMLARCQLVASVRLGVLTAVV